MTRKMKAAPEGVNLIKTTHGTWIAVQEIWDGETLMDLQPMRFDPQDGIVQARERREILSEAEKAAMKAELAEAKRKLKQIRETQSQQRERYAQGA